MSSKFIIAQLDTASEFFVTDNVKYELIVYIYIYIY